MAYTGATNPDSKGGDKPSPMWWPPMHSGKARPPSANADLGRESPRYRTSDFNPHSGKRKFALRESVSLEATLRRHERWAIRDEMCFGAQKGTNGGNNPDQPPLGEDDGSGGAANLDSHANLDFLKKSRWNPSGSRPTPIPPLREKQSSASSQQRPVHETNPRLLVPPKRKPCPPMKRPGDDVKVNSDKLIQRLYSNDVEHRRTKHEMLVKKALDGGQRKSDAALKKIEDEDEYKQRLVTLPLQHREHTMAALQRKYIRDGDKTAAASSGKARKTKYDSKEKQDAATARLFRDGVVKERHAMEAAVKKYVDDVRPQSARMSKEVLYESAKRLSAPRGQQPPT